ncbi:O-antigen ligase family protein [Specibacter cremeus]|uniref:O-antigen ligase family protein n=1 Tax=Specibacter cremeus TaxID=1629051 RepID=UPI00197B7701|nr:O-antigen ligase family protein [Specibacter cremeus]
MLSTYLFLLLVIPSDRGIGPLGAAGSPATLFGLGMMLWWAWHHVRSPRNNHTRRRQPVRMALFAFILCVLASYVVSTLSVLPFVDSNASNMVLLNVGSYAGVVLVGVDGIRDRARFVALLRRVSLMGGLYAALGLAQFFTGHNFVDSIQIPGLASGGTGGVDTRGGFVRPESTARHALEYAAVLSMILPIALTLGINERQRPLLARWFPAAAIFMAALVSVTRSALLGVVAGVALSVPTWDRRLRVRALWVGGAGLAVMYFLVPGLAGTILGMFSGGDPSVASRTDSLAVVGHYLAVSPWVGRGLGTLGPAYRIFDNQYIGLLIETGIVGLTAFVVLMLTAILTTLLRRRGTDRLLGAMGPALAGAVLAGALLCAFFDAFHFPQAVGMLFLVVGLCGAHWNMQHPSAAGAPEADATTAETGARRLGAVLRRRWYVVAAVLLLAIPAMMMARTVPGVYYAKFDLNFQAPAGATKNNALRTEASSVVKFAALVERLYQSAHANSPIIPTTAPVYGTGLRDAVAVYLPNAGGQWQTNFSTPTITVEIVKPSAEEVLAAADRVSADIVKLAAGPQNELGVWTKSRIVVQPDLVAATQLMPREKNALVGIAMLALGLSVAGAIMVDGVVRLWRQRHPRRRRTAPGTG